AESSDGGAARRISSNGSRGQVTGDAATGGFDAGGAAGGLDAGGVAAGADPDCGGASEEGVASCSTPCTTGDAFIRREGRIPTTPLTRRRRTASCRASRPPLSSSP